MIGIALVTFISVLANGLRVSNSDAIERQIQSDLIVTSQDGYSEFPAAVGDAVADVDGSRDRQQRPAGHRADRGRRREPHRSGRPGRPRCTTSAGRRARTRCSRSSAPTARCCRTTSPRIGISPSATPSPCAPRTTRRRTSSSAGIYEGSPFYPLLGTASISQEAFDELYDRPRNRFTLLNVAGDATAAKANVESALESFPDTRVQTRAEWIDKEDQEIQQFLLLLYVLLALSVIVSLFGMVNTLALSVFERTRELGMLRAVGMTRRQTRG